MSCFIQADEKAVELLGGTNVTRDQIVPKPRFHDIYEDGNLDVCTPKGPIIGEVIDDSSNELLPSLLSTFLASSQVVRSENAPSAVNYTECDFLHGVGLRQVQRGRADGMVLTSFPSTPFSKATDLRAVAL